MIYFILFGSFLFVTHQAGKMDRKGCIDRFDYLKRYSTKWLVIIESIVLQFYFRRILVLNLYFFLTTIEWCIRANKDRSRLIRMKEEDDSKTKWFKLCEILIRRRIERRETQIGLPVKSIFSKKLFIFCIIIVIWIRIIIRILRIIFIIFCIFILRHTRCTSNLTSSSMNKNNKNIQNFITYWKVIL